MLAGTEKTLKAVRDGDRALANGVSAPQDYNLPETGLAVALAQATNLNLWTADLKWYDRSWSGVTVNSVSFNDNPGYTAFVGQSSGGGINIAMNAKYASPTGLMDAQSNNISLTIINTGESYTWYGVLLIKGSPGALDMSEVRIAGVGTNNVGYARQASSWKDNAKNNTNGSAVTWPSRNLSNVSTYDEYGNGNLIISGRVEAYYLKWTGNNKSYNFRMEFRSNSSAKNEKKHVYFVKQVW